MRITKRQLRRIIREAWKGQTPAEKGAWEFARKQKNKQKPYVNMDFQRNYPVDTPLASVSGGADPLGALAAAQEMGYSLEQPPQLDSNNIAIDDALAAYPGEFTYEDIIAAVKASGGEV